MDITSGGVVPVRLEKGPRSFLFLQPRLSNVHLVATPSSSSSGEWGKRSTSDRDWDIVGPDQASGDTKTFALSFNLLASTTQYLACASSACSSACSSGHHAVCISSTPGGDLDRFNEVEGAPTGLTMFDTIEWFIAGAMFALLLLLHVLHHHHHLILPLLWVNPTDCNHGR